MALATPSSATRAFQPNSRRSCLRSALALAIALVPCCHKFDGRTNHLQLEACNLELLGACSLKLAACNCPGRARISPGAFKINCLAGRFLRPARFCVPLCANAIPDFEIRARGCRAGIDSPERHHHCFLATTFTLTTLFMIRSASCVVSPSLASAAWTSAPYKSMIPPNPLSATTSTVENPASLIAAR